jgi:hypothetical protein
VAARNWRLPVRVIRQLKKSAVVVWVRKTDTFNAVKEQMVSMAKDEPDESTEFDGMVDLHWRFDSYVKAERLAYSLRKVSHKPEIIVLRLSCYDDVTASVTLKDERQRH